MRKRVSIAALLSLGCVLLGVAAANLFPDETWRAVTMARTTYDGIVSRLTPLPKGTDRNAQEFRIYESLLRDSIGSDRFKNRLIFLSVDGSDPKDELMTHFRAAGLTVNRASERHFDQRQSLLTGHWIDQPSGRSAVLIELGSIRWVFGDRVEVQSGMSCGHLCGGGAIYELVKRHGQWTVDASRNETMS